MGSTEELRRGIKTRFQERTTFKGKGALKGDRETANNSEECGAAKDKSKLVSDVARNQELRGSMGLDWEVREILVMSSVNE